MIVNSKKKNSNNNKKKIKGIRFNYYLQFNIELNVIY